MTQMTQMSPALRKGPQIWDLCHLRHLWILLRQLPDFLFLSQRSIMRCIAAYGAVAAALMTASGCERGHVGAPSPTSVHGNVVELRPEAASWNYVELAKAATAPALPPVPVPARVAVDESRSSSVVAPLAGRVDAVAVQLGQRVQTGNRLLSIRSAAFVDLFRQIDILRAKEAAHTKVVDRVRDLVRLKASAEKDLIAAEQDINQSRLSRESAEAKLRSLSVESAGEGLYWIKAPRSGIIVNRNALVGQEAGPDRGDPLLQIAELDEVIVKADVPEADVADLKDGGKATVTSAAIQDRTFPGTIEHIGLVVDPERHMVDVRVRVPNVDGLLRPNGFVQVEFTPNGRTPVVVDDQAVVTDDQQSYVFVQASDQSGRLERKLVRTGRRRDDKVEIVQGLQAGDTYVSKGAILLLNAMDLAS